MISHRFLNNNFEFKQPKVTDVIFPQFDPNVEPRLQKITPAKSSLHLLQCHVNARNLQGHGISEMASIIKQCRSFTLSYSSFDDLRQFFTSDSGLF